MNITELARILKITPQELHDSLPQLGFDIGQKAIKINNSTANKIIKDWPLLRRRIEAQKSVTTGTGEIPGAAPVQTAKDITMGRYITVRELAAKSEIPLKTVLAVLMKNGIFSSLNEKIDHDTAWLVGSELSFEVKQKEDSEIKESKQDNRLKNIMAGEKKGSLQARPPVIVVMGHVDHGKTKLLDAVRRTNVVAGEAGGITQHIGAYQVERNDRLITFIDTPGHEAFTAMRSRGAKIADIAILVVAADDGVKPQTIEAFRIIEAAKIPYVVAINKIDKPDANIDKTKQELSSKLNIIPEDWGGKTICAPISALKNNGISELLDMVLLVAETESNIITANPDSNAVGTIIESKIDKGAGPIATLLVQNGTLRQGEELTFNGVNVGKVRHLENYRGEKIVSAAPSTPVRIIGLKDMVEVGDILEVGKGERIKQKKIKALHESVAGELGSEQAAEQKNIKTVNVIIKSDVLGSAEAIGESLEKINLEEIKVKIIHKGLGNISENDVKRAEAAGARILGFNVKLTPVIEELTREKKVIVKIYSIIYELINDIKAEMQKEIEPIITRVDVGKLKVLAIFRTDKNSQIIGGKVISGRAEQDAFAEIYRENDLIAQAKVTKLQSAMQDVSACDENQECGISIEGTRLVKIGDTIQFHKEEKTYKKI